MVAGVEMLSGQEEESSGSKVKDARMVGCGGD